MSQLLIGLVARNSIMNVIAISIVVCFVLYSLSLLVLIFVVVVVADVVAATAKNADAYEIKTFFSFSSSCCHVFALEQFPIENHQAIMRMRE